jgi:hypothetical protein
VIIWSIPSLGLFINSWRTRQAQITTGWWKVRPDEFAAFAAYGFAWIDFKGRKGLFIVTVSLLAIPLQVALIPLLQLYVLPLSVPVLAAFAIFQFLWTWNDYLIANTMVGSHPERPPDDDPHRQPGRRLRAQRTHPARRRVRPGLRPARDVPRAPALLRPRHARRARQGMIVGPRPAGRGDGVD